MASRRQEAASRTLRPTFLLSRRRLKCRCMRPPRITLVPARLTSLVYNGNGGDESSRTKVGKGRKWKRVKFNRPTEAVLLLLLLLRIDETLTRQFTPNFIRHSIAGLDLYLNLPLLVCLFLSVGKTNIPWKGKKLKVNIEKYVVWIF